MLKRRRQCLSLGLFVLPAIPRIVAAQTSTSPKMQPLRLEIISGTVGGVWYIGLGAIAKGITIDYPGSDVNLVAGGSSGNPIRLNRGAGDLSITQHTMAVAAARGNEPYTTKLENVRSILNINDITRLNIVVRADQPVHSIADIKSQRLRLRFAPGPKGTTSELFGRWVFQEYGISLKDIESAGGSLFYGGYSEVGQQMQDGHLDGFFWTGPGEASFIQDIASSVKLRWLPVDKEVIETLAKKHGVAGGITPASFYGGAVGRDIPSITDTTELIVKAGMPDVVAYLIVKSVLSHRSDIALAYNAWKSISPESAPKALGLPLHPGAEKYYREHGLLPIASK